MKTVIVAFDALRNPSRTSVKMGGRAEFARMRAAKEPLDGLTVVELWTEDRGCRHDRYFAEPNQTKTTSVKSKK